MPDLSRRLWPLLLAATWAAGQPAGDPLDGLLAAHVTAGWCDLAAVRADPRLAVAVKALAQTTEPEGTGADATARRKAHYLNAYLTFALAELCDHWPLAKVSDIDAFGSRATHVLGGKSRTLDELVEQTLRPAADPRLLLALCDGTVSGPPWPAAAYRGDKLESQLEDQARAALRRPQIARVDPAGAKLHLSRLFRWFAVDFEPVGGPAGFAAKYLPDAADRAWCQTGGYEVVWLPYDWTVGARP